MSNGLQTIPAPRSGSGASLWITTLFCAAIVVCWGFPYVWYAHGNPERNYFWLAEQRTLDGWNYSEEPVAKSAEAILVADRLISGAFTNRLGQSVQVFSAKRYEEKQNEIGLFVHTPDRCWTESGWQIEPSAPDVVTLIVHQVPIQFERRIFSGGGRRELVYFCGLTGGQTLPYRLDHNLSVGMRYQLKQWVEKTGTALRAGDSHLWTRVWEAFLSRRPLFGPKQFIRISTPISARDPMEGDRLLQSFLTQWLQPVDFQIEMRAWQQSAVAAKRS